MDMIIEIIQVSMAITPEELIAMPLIIRVKQKLMLLLDRVDS